jgi:chlorite dismutase
MAQEDHDFINPQEIPPNPTFDHATETYVAIVHFRIRPEWHALSRAEQLRITREHIKELAPFANRVARTHLSATGLGKHDTTELLEAESLKSIQSMVEAFNRGAKAAYMELVDSTITIKTAGRLVRAKMD